MRALIHGLALALIYAISISPLSARLMRIPTPDELASQSTVICTGEVESITETGKTKDGINSWDIIIHFAAKIKVLHVFKGQTPSEIEIKYNSGPNVPNGPIQIELTTGGRFRFYLKNGPTPSSLVGVLDGQADDGFAVEPLAPKEPDDSTPISQAEALEIAKKWLHDNHPDPATTLLTSTTTHVNGKWIVLVTQKGTPGIKRIVILGDRTVDAQEWDRS